jgi:hypothetical protein
MIENLKLLNETCTLIIDATLYQHIVDKLIYLTNICLDLVFAIGVVSRHMAIPQEAHLDGVKHIFKYVKGTTNFGIIYLKGFSNLLEGHTDADWARDNDNRHSTIGTCSRWGLVSSHGVRRSNPLLFFLRWNPNTVLLPKVPKNVLGYEDCTKKTEF